MTKTNHAVVIGGSMAGLFTAHLLIRRGWSVNVYERISSELAGRGAGIVTHPELFEVLDACGIDSSTAKVGVRVEGRRVFDHQGNMVGERSHPQILTSWGRLYAILKDALPEGCYHHGLNLQRVSHENGVATAHFDNGSHADADLLVGADGIFSTVRLQFMPDVMPSYVGYIAWRGLVDEKDLSKETRAAICDHFAFSLPPGEQMLGYPVAGADESIEPGHRRFNFVWYRPAAQDGALKELLTDVDGVTHALSIPPNRIRPAVIDDMRQAAQDLLSPQFAEVVAKTGQPFIQAIQDLETPKMAIEGRIALIGDAAFVARPHVGMGVTKAAADALALANALSESADVPTALATFENKRLAYGEAVIRRARHLGAYMQAQISTDEERAMAERHRHPEAIMSETAVSTGIAA
ncbi:FAD binding domain-containing protein (plasmid) [Phyllobacterium sp. A18/5-2]|uniref:FAD binding domain-containing protein n=1 Tax=Phyllobacterium sp. A18/5-2 TaxID=2978392 RepID=UPI0021C78819|nr:FAD binding domain-containing protein [Phyllobacterium sp. A18/5-2]UXN66641.1 FAD binding domain-containing protein [Phyllobacterium sp. A18/5-2]